MSESKYVVGLARAGHTEQVVAVVFPDDITHSDLAKRFFGDLKRVLGAGFCYVANGDPYNLKMVQRGESVSLNIRSRPEDAYYLSKAVGFIEAVPGDIRRKDIELARQRMQERPA